MTVARAVLVHETWTGDEESTVGVHEAELFLRDVDIDLLAEVPERRQLDGDSLADLVRL